MKNAIILHGRPDKEEYYSDEYPSASNSHWIPWLQKQLLMRDIATATPEILFSFEPQYELWKTEFERYNLTAETILIGHSCGGGFLVRWLSEHPDVSVGKVVLVAPWIDPTHELENDFFKFRIDPGLVTRTRGVTIFSSDNDEEPIQKSVELLSKTMSDIKVVPFHNYGHFTLGDMGTEVFPELLEEVIL